MSDDVRKAAVMDLLADVYTPEGVAIWWNAPNRGLAFFTPAALWEHGDESGREDVEAAVERLVSGAM